MEVWSARVFYACEDTGVGGNPDFLWFAFTIMCTSSSSSWRAGGRGLPGWLRQTPSSGRAALKPNTPDTSQRLVSRWETCNVTTSFQHIRKEYNQLLLKLKVYSFEIRQDRCSAHVYFANLNEGVWALTYFLCHGQPLGVDNGVQLLLLEFFDSVLVVSQVQLGAHQDYGRVGAVVSHLRVPLWVKRTVRSGSIQLSNTEEGMWCRQ